MEHQPVPARPARLDRRRRARRPHHPPGHSADARRPGGGVALRPLAGGAHHRFRGLDDRRRPARRGVGDRRTGDAVHPHRSSTGPRPGGSRSPTRWSTPPSPRSRPRCRRSAFPPTTPRPPSPTSTRRWSTRSPASASPSTDGVRRCRRHGRRRSRRPVRSSGRSRRPTRRSPIAGRRTRRRWTRSALGSNATPAASAASRSSLPRVRLVVPDDPGDDWEVRLELVDEVDPGRWCGAEDVWDATPLALELAGGEEHLELLAAEITRPRRRAGRLCRRRRRIGDRARAGLDRADRR